MIALCGKIALHLLHIFSEQKVIYLLKPYMLNIYTISRQGHCTHDWQKTLFLATVMFPYDVYEVVLGDQCVLRLQLGFLSFPPLLLMKVG